MSEQPKRTRKARKLDITGVAAMCIGRTLAHYRTEIGKQQWEVAEAAEVDQSTYSKYEVGSVNVSAALLMRLSRQMAVPVGEIPRVAETLFVKVLDAITEYDYDGNPVLPGWAANSRLLSAWCDSELASGSDDAEEGFE